MEDAGEIAWAEDQLRTAMLHGDLAALDALIADDAIYTEPDGNQRSKADDLAVHQSGLLRLTRINVVCQPITRRLLGGAIVCVKIELAGVFEEQEVSGTFAYTRVWRLNGNRWQVQAAHCSPIRVPGP